MNEERKKQQEELKNYVDNLIKKKSIELEEREFGIKFFEIIDEILDEEEKITQKYKYQILWN